MASVSLAVPTVGSEDNPSVTLVATPGAPSDPNQPIQIHWCVTEGSIPAGFKGGRGPATVVFAPGTFDPGTYNVKCFVVDPADASTAEANRTFTITKQSATVYTPPTVAIAP